MLTDEEIAAINAYSVEKEKERSTDAQLWERLNGHWDEECKLMPVIHYAYNIMQRETGKEREWQGYWHLYVNKAKADRQLFDCIAWHLVERGDPDIAAWLNECEEYRRVKAKELVSLGWLPDDQRKRQLPSLRLVHSRSTSDA
ncbi:hypothetical protein [Sphingomonas melonis]|uniref:hypothetical protein n=1 Tax=Sphingomonas melonis TaxID=152682 RepID=UPI0035C78DCF